MNIKFDELWCKIDNVLQKSLTKQCQHNMLKNLFFLTFTQSRKN